MSGAYDNILRLTRPQSKKHRPMPMEDRAAQFSPFAALTGYDAAVSETARCTEERIELDPQEAERLGERLAALIKRQQEQPELSLLYFVPDARKVDAVIKKRILDKTETAAQSLGQVHICV